MKNGKAPGIDVITAEVLKASGDPMVAMLHKKFNTIYDTEKTPKDWAQMMVTLIHKKADKQTLANYRATSLLLIPDKVIGRVLQNDEENRRGYRRGSVQLQISPRNGRCHFYCSTHNREGVRTPSVTFTSTL